CAAGRIVPPDERLGINAYGPGHGADVSPGAEVRAERRIVVPLDVPDDGLADAGLLTDLGDAEAGLAPGLRQRLADGHRLSPRSRRSCGENGVPEVVARTVTGTHLPPRQPRTSSPPCQ